MRNYSKLFESVYNFFKSLAKKISAECRTSELVKIFGLVAEKQCQQEPQN